MHPRGRLSRLPEGAALLRSLAGPRQPRPAGQELVRLALQFLPRHERRCRTAVPRRGARSPAREALAGARLPYARHVDDATIETRDGLLLQVIQLAGLPFETADTEELNYRKTLRETMLRALANSRFAIYHHVVRREVSPELAGEFGDAFSRALDDAWRRRLATKQLYVNELFLTLVRRPLQGKVGTLESLLRAVRRGPGLVSRRSARAANCAP